MFKVSYSSSIINLGYITFFLLHLSFSIFKVGTFLLAGHLLLLMINIYGLSKQPLNPLFASVFMLQIYSIPAIYVHSFGYIDALDLVKSEYLIVLYDITLHQQSMDLIAVIVLGGYIGHFFSNVLSFSKLPRFSLASIKFNNNNFLRINILFAISLFILLVSYVFIDINRSSDSYEIGAGFTLFFGAFYLMMYLLLYSYGLNGFNFKFNATILLFLTLMIYFGVRQLLVWFSLGIILLSMSISERNIKLLYALFFAIFLILILGLTLILRGDSVDIISFTSILDAFRLGYIFETVFTYISFGHSIDVANRGVDLFPLKGAADLLVLLIPSFFIDDKTSYLNLINFINSNDVAPFGTLFSPAERLLNFRYLWIILIYNIFIFYISGNFLKNVNKDRDYSKLILYLYFLIFVHIYSMRGGIFSGLKIFIMFGFFPYCILSFKSNDKSRIPLFLQGSRN